MKMKKLMVFSILAVMAMNLVGCGSSTSDSPEVSQTPVADEVIATEGADQIATKIVTTVKGDIEVPTNPERVVIDYFMGDALALGVMPVGTTYVYEGAFFEDTLEGVPSINGEEAYGEYSMESIVELDPDVIITAFETDYEKLSKIAPTVFVDYTNMTTEERFGLIAEVLGKEDEAKEVLEDLNKQVEVAKGSIEEAGLMDKTISLFETSQKAIYVYGNKQGRGGEILYDLIDLKAPAIIESEIIDGEQWRSLSFEVLGDYVGDYVMIGGWNEDPMDTVGGNPVWENTVAVKDNHVMEYNSNAFIYQDVLSTKLQLEFITNALLGTVK